MARVLVALRVRVGEALDVLALHTAPEASRLDVVEVLAVRERAVAARHAVPQEGVEGPPRRELQDVRVRETIFNVLGAAVDGAAVLDLFAGSGSMGISMR